MGSWPVASFQFRKGINTSNKVKSVTVKQLEKSRSKIFMLCPEVASISLLGSREIQSFVQKRLLFLSSMSVRGRPFRDFHVFLLTVHRKTGQNSSRCFCFCWL